MLSMWKSKTLAFGKGLNSIDLTLYQTTKILDQSKLKASFCRQQIKGDPNGKICSG